MGNSFCFKNQLKEPNQPVTVVHISSGGKVLRVSDQPNIISHNTSQNRIHIIRNRNVYSDAPNIKGIARITKHEGERLHLRSRNSVASNTQTGGRVLRVSDQPNITGNTSPNRIVIRNKNVSSNSPIIRANISNHERERRRLALRSRISVSSNTRIGAAKRSEDKRHGKPINTRDCTLKKGNKKYEEQPRSYADYKVPCFRYDVLKDATNNFNKKNLIGVGGFGNVYKGYFTYRTMNAAKPNEGFPAAIKMHIPQRSQGFEAWNTEMKILSQLNHPNIVKLIGCCREGNHRMLIYEYMDKGSLDATLFTENRKELNWGKRIRIAVGAARGLAYLHTYETPIIHRDIKASNVLIDSRFNVKISDFGLAKYGPKDENDHLSTKVYGTLGYFAPEYFKTGHLTAKADVYSFGVVLLEILTGSSVDERCPKGVWGNLVDRVKPLLCGSNLELRRVIDKKLRKNVPMEEAQRFAQLTYQCLSEEPNRRPTMTEVVTSLEQLQKLVSGAYIYHDAVTFA